MATTTTNFGWDIPQSTDLVKDGATAIAALGQDIDTAFIDLKGGTTGQVLSKASGTDLDFTWSAASSSDIVRIATTSFSASSAVNLNDIFSSTYKNYLVMFQITSASGTGNLQSRLRVSGADNTSSNYYSVYEYIAAASSTAGSTKKAAATEWQFTFVSDAQMAIPFTISNPYESAQTFVAAPDFFAGDGYKINSAGWYNASTSFTGISFFPTTGTITGEVTVYGMKRA